MKPTRTRSNKRSTVLLLSLLAAVAAPFAASAAAETTFRDIKVEVVGNGVPVLMVPGLNSNADTWRDTCQALQPQVQCHMVSLPGFAGRPVAEGEGEGDAFLVPMRDRLLAYIAERKLQKPAVMGHSLGGVLALQMALAQPQAVGKLVIVDSLPYFGAVQNPAATVDSVRPMAEQMRAAMLAQPEATYLAQAEASAKGLVRDPSRWDTLKTWSQTSARTATTAALYDMMTTDLRGDVAAITSPTLVLGSWAAYQPMGSTMESTRAIFAAQYAKLPGVDIRMSKAGYHFLTWDDPQWVQAQVRQFLELTP